MGEVTNSRLKETQSFPDSFPNETTQASNELFSTGSAEVGHIACSDGILHRCCGLHRILVIALVVLNEVAAKVDENLSNIGNNLIGETRVTFCISPIMLTRAKPIKHMMENLGQRDPLVLIGIAD